MTETSQTVYCVVGIDPGVTGAVAAFYPETGELYVYDMPVDKVKNSKGGTKSQVSPARLSTKLGWILTNPDASVYVEQVHAMPGQGVTSMFSFGRSLGVVEGVLAGIEAGYTLVSPGKWKAACRVANGAGKGASRERAKALFPNHAHLFERVKDDGRADAALIAYYGWESENLI